MNDVITDPCPNCGEQLRLCEHNEIDLWRCDWCESLFAECDECGGTGQVPVRQPSQRFETCPECDGEGIVEE